MHLSIAPLGRGIIPLEIFRSVVCLYVDKWVVWIMEVEMFAMSIYRLNKEAELRKYATI